MTQFESKFLSNKRGKILPRWADPFEGVYRSGGFLQVHVRGVGIRSAKAGLSRLLTYFNPNNDFLIFTPYRKQYSCENFTEVQSINDDNFKVLPAMLRKMLGTPDILAYELWVHWTERSPDGVPFERLSRLWAFVTYGTKNVPSAALLAAGQSFGRQFDQTTFIIQLNGVCSLEFTRGGAKELTTGEAIEHALFEMVKMTGDYERWEVGEDREPKRLGAGYSEVIRSKSLPDFPPQTFVTVPGSMGDLKVFGHLGMNHPGIGW